jgi:hypothetical protein
MRFARKLMLLAVAAAAVMALAATPASATNQIEVTKADGTTHCPPLGSGGCKVHQEGEITLYFHIFGIESTEAKCSVEFRGVTDEDGNGQITAQTITPGDHNADCTNATSPPCTGSLPWTGAAEKDADGKVRAHYDVCTAPAERSGSTCAGEFVAEVTETGGATETQAQSATDLRIGASSFCELDVSEATEAPDPTEPPFDPSPADDEDTHIKSI